jgi:hypothetical protein
MRRESGSNGPQYVPATPARASAAIPTGVAITGTSHASASSTARPKLSRSDDEMTAFAALTHRGTADGSMSPSVNTGTSPATATARSNRFSGRAGSAGNSRYGPLGSRPRAERASARGIGRNRPRSTPHGSTARGPPNAVRGTCVASSSETVATRSIVRSPASVIARDRGWLRSVPWSVTARARALTVSDGKIESPKWQCTMSNRSPRYRRLRDRAPCT